MLKDATNGCNESMYEVAGDYQMGIGGFYQDGKLAVVWYKKAHRAGNVMATACLGAIYAEGDLVERETTVGFMYTCIAAGAGSDMAAFNLAHILAEGSPFVHGLTKNTTEAITWLEEYLSGGCIHKHHSRPQHRKTAQDLLDKLGGPVVLT